MQKDLIDCLECPDDGGRIVTTNAGPRHRLATGVLLCSTCDRVFTVRDGIPRLLPATADGDTSQVSEQHLRDRYYQNVGTLAAESHRLPEIDALSKVLPVLPTSVCLEVGCGVGEVTRVLLGASRVVAVNLSLGGLNAFQHKQDNIELCQADGKRLPFRDATFDVVSTSHVLSHIPPEGRRAFVHELWRVLKPGGAMAVVTYNWMRRQRGLSQDGVFDGGLYYHRYSARELAGLLGVHFDIEAVMGINVVLPKTYRLSNALGRFRVYWDRLWRSRQIGIDHADYVLVAGRKPDLAVQQSVDLDDDLPLSAMMREPALPAAAALPAPLPPLVRPLRTSRE